MRLKPSEIFYSQDSIKNTFDDDKPIGETLDDIRAGRCSIEEIPTIAVAWLDGKWTTRDNRRLWVFRKLEDSGHCIEIEVYEISFIPDEKLTSNNEGEYVRVRGNPYGD